MPSLLNQNSWEYSIQAGEIHQCNCEDSFQKRGEWQGQSEGCCEGDFTSSLTTVVKWRQKFKILSLCLWFIICLIQAENLKVKTSHSWPCRYFFSWNHLHKKCKNLNWELGPEPSWEDGSTDPYLMCFNVYKPNTMWKGTGEEQNKQGHSVGS